jgi:hypothetical protein
MSVFVMLRWARHESAALDFSLAAIKMQLLLLSAGWIEIIPKLIMP